MLKKDLQTLQANYLQLADDFRMLSLELRSISSRPLPNSHLEARRETEEIARAAAAA